MLQFWKLAISKCVYKTVVWEGVFLLLFWHLWGGRNLLLFHFLPSRSSLHSLAKSPIPCLQAHHSNLWLSLYPYISLTSLYCLSLIRSIVIALTLSDNPRSFLHFSILNFKACIEQMMLYKAPYLWALRFKVEEMFRKALVSLLQSEKNILLLLVSGFFAISC